MQPFQIESCLIQDAAALARTNISAFWTDPSWVLMWRDKTMEYVISQAIRRMPRNLLQDRAHRRHQKAVNTETGEIVGYVQWVLPEGLPNVENVWVEAIAPDVLDGERDVIEREYHEADWAFDRSLDVLDEQFSNIKQRLMEGQDYMLLNQLAVKPECRRQGIGTRLVRSGLQEADRLGLDVFVHGKKAGLGLYRKLGFELIEQLILDDSSFGGSGDYGAYFLLRKSSLSALR